MAQNYKIFHNDHCLSLVESFQIDGTVGGPYSGRIDGPEGIAALAALLSSPARADMVIACSIDSSEVIRGLRKHLKYIVAGGGIVENPEGKILLIRRKGVWDLPKGKKEKSESRREAALREVAEETGLSDLVIVSKLDPTYHIYKLPRGVALKKTYWYHMKSKGGALIPQVEEAITGAEWIEPSRALSLMSESYPSLYNLMLNNMHRIVKDWKGIQADQRG